ncbi:MAG: T9SS C-terminal target domain-containing protein [Bacteroidetes bacterium]|nr:MAG: T9SS C-terminal target domain-containing protein [Bacteroidota bacterium]
MITMRNSIISLFLFLVMITGFAQTTGIGQWRDHLPYSHCIAVKEVGSRIYCATPYSIFYYDKEDNSIQRINKINGLSDIGISTMNYNATYNTLVIAYTNANIDLIKNNTILNILDIKRASILGNKTINDIYFIGQYAYLSCGFGIVVLDLDKEEIHDTYYIGTNGAQVNVLGLTKDDQDTLFAATAQGVYLAYAKSSNLANYQSWKKDTRLNGSFKYDNILNFNGQVIVSQYRTSPAVDTLYRYANGQWNKWVLDFSNPVEHLESTYGKLVISCDHFVKFFDTDFNRLGEVYTYNGIWPSPSDAIFDKGGLIWIADKNAGLVSVDISGNFNPINISGPLSPLVFAITAYGNDVYVVPGGREPGYTPNRYNPEIYHYNSTSWTNITAFTDPGLVKVKDLSTISVDPSDPRRIYSGSFGNGLIEFYDGKMVNRYGYWNSTLRYHSASDTSDIRVGGTAFDSDGNLWVVNSHTNDCISRYCKSCLIPWTGYNVPIIGNDDLGQMIIDHNNQKWVVMRILTSVPGSLLVFKEDATIPANSKYIMLNQQPGSGNIPGQTVFAMAVDKNGQVWVGTEKGIGVFFNPENIFTGQDFDAQQILVQQGAYVQYLMENEKVTALAVDGANRKWIGTEGGGLYLFSEDGTKQIYHFTTENSPLLSDNILVLAIDPETGEVFIGTDQGLVSYKGTATEGDDNFSCVYAYPNPVKEDYDGLIGIKCLVTNAKVRITDIEGNLIFSTKAEGGQAVWDGKNFNGRKAKSGVYLVYAGNNTGTQKIVTKILIIH